MTTAESISELNRFEAYHASKLEKRDKWEDFRQAVQWAREQGMISVIRTPTQYYKHSVLVRVRAVKSDLESGMTLSEALKSHRVAHDTWIKYQVKL
jgi:hypothetical protein